MLQVGDVIQNRYRIERTLGKGGMGGVFLATHLELDDLVAVKEMTLQISDPAQRQNAVQLFRAEAQILRKLRHTGLPRVHDFFEFEGNHYLVMDYIQGRTLDQVINGPMAEFQVLAWANELTDVLDYLHNHDPQVIFRDLKPSNIMLADDGHIKLIDFGIAKIFDPATGGGTQTMIRGAGTPGFAAPEQYGTGTDVRTDIYALGATLYCALTAQLPPQSTDVASGVCRVTPIETFNPTVSVTTSGAIEAMMNTNRGLRPQTIKDVRGLLRVGSECAPTAAGVGTPGGMPVYGVPTVQRDDVMTILPVTPPSQDLVRPSNETAKAQVGPTVKPAPGPQDTALQHVDASPTMKRPAEEPATAPVAAPAGSKKGLLVGLAAVVLAVVAALAFFGTRPQAAPPVAAQIQLSVNSTPAQAKVFVDNAERGITPVTLGDLKPGEHSVRIVLAGYADGEQKVSLQAGKDATVNLTLSQAVATLPVTSDPEDVDVYVDGKLKGKAGKQAVSLDLGEGPHTLEFRKAGYDTRRRQVTLQAGQNKLVHQKLSLKAGGVNVAGTGDADVVVDNVARGKVPLIVQPLPAGKHRVRLDRVGFTSETREVEIPPGQTVAVRIDLKPEVQPQPQPHPTVTLPGPSPSRTVVMAAPPPTTQIVPGKSLAGVDLGMNTTAALERINQRYEESKVRAGVRYRFAPLALDVVGRKGHVEMVSVNGPVSRLADTYRTPRGTHCGSSMVDVAREFGSDFAETQVGKEVHHFYQHQGIGFSFLNSRVLRIWVVRPHK